MRQAKPKKVPYQLIPAQSDFGTPIYLMLRDVIELDHPELRDARIVLGWHTAMKADVDGNVPPGVTKKASDLDRELAAYDFVILLNRPLWLDDQLDDDQRRAILDHLVCYADIVLDGTLEPKEDERGRKVYRKKKPEVYFASNVERYGLWHRKLQDLAKTLATTRPARLEKQAQLRVSECQVCHGTTYVDVLDAGVPRVTRCACFTEAQAIRAKALDAPGQSGVH